MHTDYVFAPVVIKGHVRQLAGQALHIIYKLEVIVLTYPGLHLSHFEYSHF